MDSADKSVRQISELLYQIHDDTVDHPISVTQTTWDALLRIAVFLDTDLAASEVTEDEFWPFSNQTEWNVHRNKIQKIGIPPYDPEFHALPVHGPLNRIPTLVGIVIIAFVIGLLVVVLNAAR